MTMNLDALLMATNELRDTCPGARIIKVVPALDGICFESNDGHTYKYEFDSGCIYRSYKTNWRTGTPPVQMTKN